MNIKSAIIDRFYFLVTFVFAVLMLWFQLMSFGKAHESNQLWKRKRYGPDEERAKWESLWASAGHQSNLFYWLAVALLIAVVAGLIISHRRDEPAPRWAIWMMVAWGVLFFLNAAA